jgi:hypothetical protein
MKCHEAQQAFGTYWDLVDDDSRKAAVNQHLLSCPNCSEEFHIWEESMHLIRSATKQKEDSSVPDSISGKVMQRIYQEDTWRVPIQNRVYRFSDKLRSRLVLSIAICLSLFLYSLIFAIVGNDAMELETASSDIFDIQVPQEHLATNISNEKSMDGHEMGTAVASLSTSFIEPLRFQIGSMQSSPQYMLVLSFLGLVYCFLIMSWFLRTRS